MNKFHEIENVKLEDGCLKLIVDGSSIEKPLIEISRVLDNATPAQQKEFEVTPSGYGIHWPLIDEDISIDGLLGIEHRPQHIKKIA